VAEPYVDDRSCSARDWTLTLGGPGEVGPGAIVLLETQDDLSPAMRFEALRLVVRGHEALLLTVQARPFDGEPWEERRIGAALVQKWPAGLPTSAQHVRVTVENLGDKPAAIVVQLLGDI
jgi:hypothetical protein